MFYPMSHVPHFGRMVPDFVVPICLPFLDPAEEDYMNVTSKTLTRVAGWGATTERGTQSIGLQGSPDRQSPDLVKFVTALLLLPGFACSIHATWGQRFSRALYMHKRLEVKLSISYQIISRW